MIEQNNLLEFCKDCQKNRLAQKDGLIVGDSGEPAYKKGEFIVRCDGICADAKYIPGYDKVVKNLTPDEVEMAQGLYDPLIWAEKNINWIPRKSHNLDHSYQEMILRCSSPRKVLRLGRRLGKTEVLVISILHFLFTNSPKVQRWDENQQMFVDGFSTILVLTPYLSQIKLIFARIRELIERNPNLAREVKKDVSTPYHHLELFNGAKVVGFSSGAKSGSGAETARGQKADFIVLDEMDYLNENDIETILALLMEHADVKLLCSSTPSGRREYFFNFCQERMDFKEFYYPAHSNPAWSPQMESELREFYRTEAAWQHEILAEFGEAVTGVFQHKYVQEARKSYYYRDMSPQNAWTYSIGVDWNDTANGTKLVVTGWDPRKQKFRIVDKVTVQKVGWTQTAAIDALIDLNRIWKPDFIYVDEGYGATQIEIIKQFGLEAKFRTDDNAKIDQELQKIIGVNSSAKIEVYDPITKEPIKKSTKPFMVENAVRRFERQQVEFSEYDEDLYRQLIGFQIIKVNTAGTPIYEAGPDGDHDLDAFILSLLAFQMELSELTNVNYSTNITFSGRIGEGSNNQGGAPEATAPQARELSPQVPEVRSDYSQSLYSLLPSSDRPAQEMNRIYSPEAFSSDNKRPVKALGRKYLRPRTGGLTSRRNI